MKIWIFVFLPKKLSHQVILKLFWENHWLKLKLIVKNWILDQSTARDFMVVALKNELKITLRNLIYSLFVVCSLLLNPNWHDLKIYTKAWEGILLSPLQHFIFNFLRGVMDKAVDSGSNGPRFEPCLRHMFLFFLLYLYKLLIAKLFQQKLSQKMIEICLIIQKM